MWAGKDTHSPVNDKLNTEYSITLNHQDYAMEENLFTYKVRAEQIRFK